MRRQGPAETKVSAVQKKYLARSFPFSFGYVFAAKTSDRYPFQYKPTDLKGLFSFQFCRSLSGFCGRLYFAKFRNRFFGLSIGNDWKPSALSFQAARITVNGFQITSQGISEFIYRIRKTTESSLRQNHCKQFSLTNSLLSILFQYRADYELEPADSPQTF